MRHVSEPEPDPTYTKFTPRSLRSESGSDSTAVPGVSLDLHWGRLEIKAGVEEVYVLSL